MVPSSLIERARLHVRRHFARHIPKWMLFHDLDHTLSVTRAALDIGRGSGLGSGALRTLELAALFHDTGYANAYKGHEKESVRLAKLFLREHHASTKLIADVTRAILATRTGIAPRTLIQRVLKDADSAKAGQADFDQKSERLRLEFQHQRGKRFGEGEWGQENLAYLLSHRFFTPYALRRFSRQKAINLSRLEKRVALPKKKRDPLQIDKVRFFDRDLSWLAFNARVLQEAQDERVPLLDRLKFLAIHSSNLDEFYRVRVAQLHSLSKLGKRDRSALEVPPEKRIERINKEALAQQRVFGKLYRERLLPALAKHGVRFLNDRSLTVQQRAFVQQFFSERIAPLLQTASLRAGNAPFIEDRKLYMVCELLQKGSKKRKRVLVNVPSDELGRFITLPSRKGITEFLFMDDAIRCCAPHFFKGFKLVACHAIKLSRDAELYLDEEFAENVVDKVRRSLRKRRTGSPARFLYDGAMPRSMLHDLRDLLGVKKPDLIPGGRYHNFIDMMALPVAGHSALREQPMTPIVHPALRAGTDPFPVMRKSDVLLEFPYHDFRSVVDMLRRAAKDPAVERISITLYRVARGSLICESLLDAARNGKVVTVFMEVQARFDEGNNLFWGEALEQSGARVIYGREGWKVHCKLCLIERREPAYRTGRHARIVRYCYLGTGNFNERTAAIYSDFALLTTHAGITRDVSEVFDHLLDHRHAPRVKHLLVAPDGLRSAMERSIDREIANALQGKPASILLKLNSLEDRPLIRKLYDASNAGVHVRLIVRGICCLVPGVPGLSDWITGISIIDRFLEHARVYVFHNNGKSVVHLSSADWMERNMDRRVEVAFPVLNGSLCERIMDFLERQWSDNTKARILDEHQTNAYRKRIRAERIVRAQMDEYAKVRKESGKKP